MIHNKKVMYKYILKRILDLTLSLIEFMILSPIFLLVTILLILANKGKPFFLQSRPGKNEKLFNIIKFKTMTDEKDSDGALLPDENRMTTIGSFVRRTSLDEIPQLINVIIGDMNLIDPRTLLLQYLTLNNQNQKRQFNYGMVL